MPVACKEPPRLNRDPALPSQQAVEIIAGRYYLAVLNKGPEYLARSPIAASNLCYCIDHDLVSTASRLQWEHHLLPCCSHASLLVDAQLYEPFYADFGPLNMGRTYRFCETTARLLQVRAVVLWLLAS